MFLCHLQKTSTFKHQQKKKILAILTHGGRLVLHQLRQRPDRNLERLHVERRHVVLAATLVAVVDDVLPDVVLGGRFLVEAGRPTPGARKIQE